MMELTFCGCRDAAGRLIASDVYIPPKVIEIVVKRTRPASLIRSQEGEERKKEAAKTENSHTLTKKEVPAKKK
jgi:hypothetical protein